MTKHLFAYQPSFRYEECLRNLHMLSDHFIAVFRHLFSKLPVGSFLPNRSDYRCNLLSYHLLLWELFAIYAPEEIKIDVFELLKSRGGAIFFNFFIPTGKLK